MRARAIVAAALPALVVLACSSSGTAPAQAVVDGGAGAQHDAAAGATPDGSGSSTLDAAFTDATSPADGSAAPDAAPSCGVYAGDDNFTCSADGNSRGECADGGLDLEACPNGCLIEPAGQDSVCMGTTDDWSCAGSYGTIPAADGNYYITEFGCFTDDAGVHTDPDDNCIPGCLSKAQAAGLCQASDTGPECEERVTWYVADAGRFGCLQRLRVTNPANGKTLVAVALDFGPACSGEATVQHAVLDSSGAVDDYLFGGAEGSSDKALVHVVEVADTTPLGPVP